MRQRAHRPARAYAAIPNAAMRNQRISIEARGLLALMMTYADDWTFFVEHLQTVAGVGREKLRGMLRELERAGYVLRERRRGAGGHLAGTEWVILDEPAGADDADASAVAADRSPENPSIGVTDRPENRPSVEPIIGETAPIRRTTNKKTNLKKSPNPLPGSGDGVGSVHFDDFWAAFPDPVERDAAMKAHAAVLAQGEISPEALARAAAAYARSRQVERGYGMKPANWLARGGWRDGGTAPAEAAPAAVDLDASARQWAGAVKAGRGYCASGIRPPVARRMLDLGLVSAAELQRVGVAA